MGNPFTILLCVWGRLIGEYGDTEACYSEAVEEIVLHDGPIVRGPFRLCAKHAARVDANSQPHRCQTIPCDHGGVP